MSGLQQPVGKDMLLVVLTEQKSKSLPNMSNRTSKYLAYWIAEVD